MPRTCRAVVLMSCWAHTMPLSDSDTGQQRGGTDCNGKTSAMSTDMGGFDSLESTASEPRFTCSPIFFVAKGNRCNVLGGRAIMVLHHNRAPVSAPASVFHGSCHRQSTTRRRWKLSRKPTTVCYLKSAVRVDSTSPQKDTAWYGLDPVALQIASEINAAY